MMAFAVRRFGAAATGFDASLHAEMEKFKVAPAAGWWMRTYGVLPSDVEQTGPRGYIVKGDVLKVIKAKNLSMRPKEEAAPTPSAPKEEPKAKKATAPKK